MIPAIPDSFRHRGVGFPRWLVLDVIDAEKPGGVIAMLDGTRISHAMAEGVGQMLADAAGKAVIVVQEKRGPGRRSNPTLVHHGMDRSADWHVLWTEAHRKTGRGALADLYTPSRSMAVKIAQAIAQAVDARVTLVDNLATPAAMRDHPTVWESEPYKPRRSNPSPAPRAGETWIGTLDGQRDRVLEVNGSQVRILHTETGNRETVMLSEFVATHRPARRTNPRAKLDTYDILTPGHVLVETVHQVTRAQAIQRARELEKKTGSSWLEVISNTTGKSYTSNPRRRSSSPLRVGAYWERLTYPLHLAQITRIAGGMVELNVITGRGAIMGQTRIPIGQLETTYQPLEHGSPYRGTLPPEPNPRYRARDAAGGVVWRGVASAAQEALVMAEQEYRGTLSPRTIERADANAKRWEPCFCGRDLVPFKPVGGVYEAGNGYDGYHSARRCWVPDVTDSGGRLFDSTAPAGRNTRNAPAWTKKVAGDLDRLTPNPRRGRPGAKLTNAERLAAALVKQLGYTQAARDILEGTHTAIETLRWLQSMRPHGGRAVVIRVALDQLEREQKGLPTGATVGQIEAIKREAWQQENAYRERIAALNKERFPNPTFRVKATITTDDAGEPARDAATLLAKIVPIAVAADLPEKRGDGSAKARRRGRPFSKLEPGTWVMVPYQGRDSYFGRAVKKSVERARVEGETTTESGAPAVLVAIPRGSGYEHHTVPREQVRKAPKRDKRPFADQHDAEIQRALKKYEGREHVLESDIARVQGELEEAYDKLREIYPQHGEKPTKEYTYRRARYSQLKKREQMLTYVASQLAGFKSDLDGPWSVANPRGVRGRMPTTAGGAQALATTVAGSQMSVYVDAAGNKCISGKVNGKQMLVTARTWAGASRSFLELARQHNPRGEFAPEDFLSEVELELVNRGFTRGGPITPEEGDWLTDLDGGALNVQAAANRLQILRTTRTRPGGRSWAPDASLPAAPARAPRRARAAREGNNRDFAIHAIKSALKRRSGIAWSVTAGRGTTWGWLTINAPNKMRTWEWYLPEGAQDWPENYRERDTGIPGKHMGPELRATLAKLLGFEFVRPDGVSVDPQRYDWFIDRAEGDHSTPEPESSYYDNPRKAPPAELINDLADVLEAFEVHGDFTPEQLKRWARAAAAGAKGQSPNVRVVLQHAERALLELAAGAPAVPSGIIMRLRELTGNVPNPRRGDGELERAERTFRMWHEFDAKTIKPVKLPRQTLPKYGVKLGEIVTIDYVSDKWEGKPVTYTHDTKRPRPQLVTDPDGEMLFIVGGKMKPTADGLVN